MSDGRNDETQDTLAPESGDRTLPASEACSSPVVVRAGAQHDLPELLPVDPRLFVRGEEIARGGMGRIVAARDRRLGRPVAIKELLDFNSQSRARFEREARITARLQHPAIVSLYEAGAWPSGEPFYVMRLVEGRPLDQLIAARSYEQRLRLLPNVIAVADALGYAHARGVIHRDLKPANVLVGEYGETVVIDWGLAKDLGETGAPEPPQTTVPAREGETVEGAVMGTPAYMSPEQAQGEAVDARTDVYALGAMLYHVLAGEPPYRGRTSDEILVQVVAGPPPSLRERPENIPPDLITIVETALAADPSARFATARELAEELKKFQAGQLVQSHRYTLRELCVRWMRRHRVALSAAGVLLAVLAVTIVLAIDRVVDERDRADAARAVADEQRDVARTNQRDVEDLMSFMLLDLKTGLESAGRLDLLASVANKATSYYASRPLSALDDELARRATALANLGDVFRAQAKLADALAAQRNALALREGIAARTLAIESQLAVVTSRSRVADLLLASGQSDAALQEMRGALALAQVTVARAPSNDDAHHAVVDAQETLATTLTTQGKLPDALAMYRAALTTAAGRAAATGDPDWKRQECQLHADVARVLMRQGALDEARVEYAAAVEIAETLVAGTPSDTRLQVMLTTMLDRLGTVLEKQGNLSEAFLQYRRVLALDTQLAERDPTNNTHQTALARAHGNLARVLSARNQSGDALRELRAAMDIAVRQAELDPNDADRARAVALGHEKLGRLMEQTGDADAALEHFRDGMAIVERLAAADPADMERASDVRVFHASIARMLAVKGDRAGALAERRKLVAMLEDVVAKQPTSAGARQELYWSSMAVAELLTESGDLEGAAAAFRAAFPVAEALVTQSPTHADAVRMLAIGHRKLARVLLKQGKSGEASVELSAALTAADELAAREPTSVIYRDDLAKIHGDMATLARARGDHAAALAHIRTELALYETLAAEQPDDPWAQEGVAIAYGDLGDLHRALHHRVDALAAYQKALAIIDRLVAKGAKEPRLRGQQKTLHSFIARTR